MKKRYFSIAVLSLSALAFVSCKKDDKSGTAGDMMSFTATIDNGGAKTVIDDVNVKWTSDDKISINGKTFTAEVEGDGTTAVFTGETVVEAPYKALYPESLYKGVDSYELPNEQTYNEADKLSGVNPMYAYSETTELQFHHLCGLLKLDVKGEGKVKKIEVSKDGEALCGSFIIKENRAVVTSGTAGSTVTLNCGAGVPINSTTATTFYIALPEGNYKDLNVKLINGSVSKDTTLSAAIHAGKIRTKELTGVDVVKPVPPYCISGEFSVSADETVYFSEGNLYYDGSESKWKFESNQWDFRTYNGNCSCIDGEYNATGGTPDSDWGAFGWSGSNQTHYGMSTSTNSNDYSGDFNDWGCITDLPDNVSGKTWRTLSKDKWDYLLNTRDNAAFLRARVELTNVTDASGDNKVSGLVILPDGSTVTASSVDTKEEIASSGAVFLPAFGYRYGPGMSSNYYASYGYYWSSSTFLTYSACCMKFNSNDPVGFTDHQDRYFGLAVRLVR